MTWEEDVQRLHSTKRIKIVAIIGVVLLMSGISAYAVQQYYGKAAGNVVVNGEFALSISPNPIKFTVSNGSSAQQVVQITNNAQISLTLESVNFTGSFNPSYFSVSINDSGTVIQPGKTVNSLLTLSCNASTPQGSYSGTWYFTAT